MATVENDTTPPIKTTSLVVLLIVLVSAGVGVWQLSTAARMEPRPEPPLQAFLWLGIAVSMLLVDRIDVTPIASRLWDTLQEQADIRLLAAALINVAGVAFVATSTAVPPGFLVAVWCFGLVLYLFAFVRHANADQLHQLLRAPAAWALCGFLLIAFYIRWQSIGSLPWPMAEDEGQMAMEAVRFLRGSAGSPFGLAWLQQPNLFSYLQSLGIRLFGWNLLSVRIVSVLAGSLTVVPVFVLADELFDRTIAWTAAALLIVLPFHVHYSRIGVNNIVDPFFGAAALWSLLRATRTRQPLWWALAGVLLGVGLYFYGTFKIALALAAFWIILTVRLAPEEWDGQWANLTWLFGGFILGIAPLLRGQRTIADVVLRFPFQPDIVHSGELLQEERSMLATVLRRTYRAALGFFALDDRTYLYEPARPLLNLPSQLLALLGIGRLVARWYDRRSLWLGAWLLVPLLVDGLLPDPPTSSHLVFLIPALVIIVALGIAGIARATRELLWPDGHRSLSIVLPAFIIAIIVYLNLSFYVNTYLPGPFYANQNMEIASEAGRLIAEQRNDPYVYWYGAPRVFFGHGSLQFLGRLPDGQDGPTPAGDFSFVNENRSTLFIFLPEQTDTLNAFRNRYPAAEMQQVTGRTGELLFVWARIPQ